MVHLLPLIALLVLLPTSQADFVALSQYDLNLSGFDSKSNKFKNQVMSNIDLGPSDPSVTLARLVGCASINLNAAAWWLEVDLTAKIIYNTIYAVSFWAYFDSTVSDKVFQFGDSASAHYVVSSTTNGDLKFIFYQDQTFDLRDSFDVTVPLKKWFAIAFSFWDASPVIINVPMVGLVGWIHTSPSSSNAQFAMPSPIIQFGKAITGKFYQLWVSDSLVQDADANNLFLKDSNAQQQTLACPCNSHCSDAACLDGLKCLSAMTAVCTVCPADYFLHEDSATSMSCVGKIYVACADSCNYCKTADCFLCAQVIALDETTCRVDSIGYSAQYVSQTIGLKFASKLPYGLAFNSITATSNSGTPITTSGWGLSGCTKGVYQCTILAPGLFESDFPIGMDFEFDQTS